jgi:hypothetical protein
VSDPRDYTYDTPDDDGVLEPDDTLSTDDLEDDPLDTGIEPPDHYGASNWYGVTEAEARRGESLDQLLAEEEQDPNDEAALDFGPGDQEHGGVDENVDFQQELGDEDGEFGDGGPVVDDRWADGPGPRSGRLVTEGRLAADDVGPDADAAGAEEAAVHVTDEEEIRYHPSHEE